MVRKQFTVYLENKPGVLARLSKKLAAAKINIEGISAYSSTDVGLVQLVVSQAAPTRAVLKASGLAFTVQDVVLMPIENKPGALADLVSKIAKAGGDINYLYSTGCDGDEGCHCYVVIGVRNLKPGNDNWKPA